MKNVNGHRSWNSFNVYTWLHNDEVLYSLWNGLKEDGLTLNHTVTLLLQELRGQKTPDGAVYNRLSIKEALEEHFTNENI